MNKELAEAVKRRRSLIYNSKNGTWTDPADGLALDHDDVRELDRTLAAAYLATVREDEQLATIKRICEPWLHTKLGVDEFPQPAKADFIKVLEVFKEAK